MKDQVNISSGLCKILYKLKSRHFRASGLSSYNFTRLIRHCNINPHNLIKDKFLDLTERTFLRDNSPNLAFNEKHFFLLLSTINIILCGLVRTLFCFFCYESDFMLYLSLRASIIEAFNVDRFG